MKYYLDPDFRPNPGSVTKPFCARCQKSIKDISKAVQVVIDWDTWEVIEASERQRHSGKAASVEIELIGSDCWKQIIREAKK